MPTVGVYEILNTVNGKRYIGSSVDFAPRWRLHRRQLREGGHHSVALQRAWNKYGESAFKFLPILTCARSMLRLYEQQLLDKVRPEYNIASDVRAPMLGRQHSAQTRAKLSAKAQAQMAVPGAREAASKANRGRKRTAAQIEASASAHRGKSISPAHRTAISAAMIGNTNGAGHAMAEAQKAALIGNKYAAGHTHTAEWCKTMSEQRKGRIFSEQHRENMSAAAKVRGISSETLAKMAAAKRGVPWSSARRAAHDLRMQREAS